MIMRSKLSLIALVLSLMQSRSAMANSDHSERLAQYNACMEGKANVSAPGMECTLVNRNQLTNACYSYGAVGIFQRALKREGIQNAPRLSRECAALFFLASKIPTMPEEDWNRYLNTIRRGTLLPEGRDDKLLEWILINPILPDENQCSPNRLAQITSELQKVALDNNPTQARSKIQQSIYSFAQPMPKYVSPLGGKSLYYRVHDWHTTIELKNPSARQCPEQDAMIKHYLCAQIPVSMSFIKSAGCTTKDKKTGECKEPSSGYSTHSAIAYEINHSDSKINYIESASKTGLDPSEGLWGNFNITETCRISRITALMTTADKSFLDSIEAARRITLHSLITNTIVNHEVDTSQFRRGVKNPSSLRRH